MSINLDTASREEMKKYGLDELNIQLSLTMREDTMRQRCRDAMLTLGIKEAAAPLDLAGHHANKDNWVVINIQRSEGKHGGEPVFVGFNGKGFTIPRGIDVAVPPPVEAILRNAIKTVYEQDVENMGELTGRDVLNYPYSVVGGHANRVGIRDMAA